MNGGIQDLILIRLRNLKYLMDSRKKVRKNYNKEAIVCSKYTVTLILYDLAFISSGKTS